MAPLSIEQRVGKTLATMRGDLGLSQGKVAKSSGLSQRTISFVERGERPTLFRYVEKMAKAMGFQILFVPISKGKDQMNGARPIITAEKILEELAYVGFSRITDIIDIDSGAVKKNIPEDAKASISSYQYTRRKGRDGGESEDIKIRLYNKIQALEKMGQHVGLFNDLNAALGTLVAYGEIERTDDGCYIFRPTSSGKAIGPGLENKVSSEGEDASDLADG